MGETKMGCNSRIHDWWILLFGECHRCHDDQYHSAIFAGDLRR